MAGSVGAAVVALSLPEVGGIAGLLSHAAVRERMAMWPVLDFSTTAGRDLAMTIFIVPLAVQWWAAWYPGAEPGGGGYVAQRMLAAKDERHATGATLLFNAAHYALRPWPWILVALASLILFPDRQSLQQALPAVDATLVGDDLAYPAMLARLPAGLLGLVASSLAAAYMSTISTQLNWGASYVANDIWLRFVRPHATERELVAVGRVMTIVLMALAAFLALRLASVYQGFLVLLKIGAGTGLIYILRWFWWRVNASAEIVAMVVSFAMAAGFFIAERQMPGAVPPEWQQFLWIVGVTTVAWVAAAYLGPAESDTTLEGFLQRARPGGPGWRHVIARAHAAGRLTGLDCRWNVPVEVVLAVAGCVAIYGGLFATGHLLYGEYGAAAVAAAASAAGVAVAALTFRRAVG
jgi:Na+/proline symporter